MGEFFHGWRRKTGVVTVLLALVFMAGWVRSHSAIDTLVSPISNDRVTSLDGSLVSLVLHEDTGNGLSFPGWETNYISDFIGFDDRTIEWHWRCFWFWVHQGNGWTG